MMIHYSTTTPLPPTTFIDLLRRSTLAERRPVDDAETIAGMLANADLTVTCLLYTSPSPRDGLLSRMPSSA